MNIKTKADYRINEYSPNMFTVSIREYVLWFIPIWSEIEANPINTKPVPLIFKSFQQANEFIEEIIR